MNKELYTYILNDIYAKSQYIPTALFLGSAFFCVIKLLIILIRKKKDSPDSSFILWLSCCYGVILLYLTLFEREAGSRQAVSLKLFETFGDARSNAYVVENVLLFVPFGVLGSCFWKCLRNPVVFLAIGAVCSALIEVVQFITQRGYFQVDDIVMNSLGSGIGCLCFLLIRWMVRKLRWTNVKRGSGQDL